MNHMHELSMWATFCAYIRVCIGMYACVHVCMCVCTCVCMHSYFVFEDVFVHVYVRVSVHVCVRKCVHVCLHMYTYTHSRTVLAVFFIRELNKTSCHAEMKFSFRKRVLRIRRIPSCTWVFCECTCVCACICRHVCVRVYSCTNT